MTVKKLSTGIVVTMAKKKGVQVIKAYTKAEWELLNLFNIKNLN